MSLAHVQGSYFPLPTYFLSFCSVSITPAVGSHPPIGRTSLSRLHDQLFLHQSLAHMEALWIKFIMLPSIQYSYPPFMLCVWKMCPRKVLPGEDVDADPAGFYARKSATTLAIQLTLTTVTLVFVICHVYAGWARRTSLKWNDFFLVVAGVTILKSFTINLHEAKFS